MANRLRVARLALGRYRPLAETAPDAARHRQLDALIRRHLPGVTASLLGQPSLSADGGFIDWYSDLAGQPLALGALAKEARAEARALLADRLTSIAALAERLEPVDPASAGQLREALSFPGEETVYVVGGQPVITFWGHRPLTAAEPPPLEPPVAASAPAPDPASGRWHGRGLWLGLALLVLAAAGAALLGSGALRWPPWGPDFAGLMAAAKEEENALSRRVAALETNLNEELARCAAGQALIAARGEEERLRTVLAGARTRLTDALALCPLKQQLQGAADEGQDLNRRIDQLAGNMNAVLAQCRREQEEAKRKVAEEQEKAMAAARQAESQRRTPKEQRQAVDGDAAKAPPKAATSGGAELPPCPGERPPEDAPDVAIVLDASGSMGFSASASTAEIQKQLRSLGGLIGLGAMVLGGTSGPTRLDEAKTGVNNVVRSLPDDVDVGLVTLQHCPRATGHGFYSGAQRGALYGMVAGLRPMQGTPLAQGLIEAGAMVDGVDAPAVLVVISDGEDSCGQDPCAAARRLKNSKAKLKINVVDIVGDGAANCLASITGGRVLQPEDGLSFEKMITRATQEALKPPHCP